MVAVPEPVRVGGLIAPHVRPGGAGSVSVIVPLKWLSGVMVMVEVADWPV
jgi:hypothetical protein